MGAETRNSHSVVVVGVSRRRSAARGGWVGLLASNRGVGTSLGRASIQVSLVLIHSPVENVVVLEALPDEEVTEDLAEVAVVGLVIEAEGARVVEIDGELVREATAEDLGGGCHLLLHDTIVLLLLGGSLEALPRERATAEVQHDVAEGLHIVTARLLCCVRVSKPWKRWLRVGSTYQHQDAC